MIVPTFVELVDHVRQQERRMTDLERQMQTLAKDASMHLDASNGRVFFLEKEQAKTTVEILALKTKIMTLEQRLDEHGAEHEPAAENIRMMRVHDRGKGKMFIPDDEYNAYVNINSPAAADSGPVLCPNCGEPMYWHVEHEGYTTTKFFSCGGTFSCYLDTISFTPTTNEAEAAAIVRRMRGAR